MEILDRWAAILDQLETDVFGASAQVDWIAKYKLISSFRDRHGVGLEDPRIKLMDLQWADLRKDKGLYYRLAARGAMETLFDDAQIAQAVLTPPSDTRAYVRGKTLQRYAPYVVAANWDALSFSVPGARRIQRVYLTEPLAGTEQSCGDLFEAQLQISEFIDQLYARL